jgi:rsbT co-antagonist protein RsbR
MPMRLSAQELLEEMGFTLEDVERRKKVVGLEQADLQRIATVQGVVTELGPQLTNTFFDFLRGLNEADGLLKNPPLLEEARKLKTEHLLAMVSGHYGLEYVEQRLRLGLIYSQSRLDVRIFIGAFHHLLKNLGAAIMKGSERSPQAGFEAFMSLEKLAFFDLSIITDVLVFERERTISEQQQAIRELSTPVLKIRERLLLLPLVGTIDSRRAAMITENVLHGIRSNRAKGIVIDVTGVPGLDSKVARNLLRTVAAAELMGAKVVVTGISADVAQSLTVLGMDLSRFNAVGDLERGLESARLA